MTTISLSVSCGSDDAHVRSGGQRATYSHSADHLRVGNDDTASGEPLTTGIRFSGVAVPRGATISSATLSLVPYWYEDAVVAVRIAAEAADDSTTFSAAAHPASRRRSATSVRWDLSDWPRTVPLYEQPAPSPDLSAVLQEVVGRPGWRTGNALTLLLADDGSDDWYAYQVGSFEGGDPAVLTITYEEASVAGRTPAGSATPPAGRLYRRGVNVAGGEFGDGGSAYDDAGGPEGALSYGNPGRFGTDYLYPTRADLEYLRTRMPVSPVARLNVRMERLTTGVGGPLRDQEAERLTAVLDAAHRAGVGVVLAPWNFGAVWEADGSGGSVRRAVGSDRFPVEAFADFWARMVRRWGGHPGLVAADLMTEPVALPGGAAGWERAAQAAVDAIRGVSRDLLVWVPTYGWGIDEVHAHPVPWIVDRSGRTGYTGHHYSYNRGGSQTDYGDALAVAVRQGFRAGDHADALHARELQSVAAFAAWLDGRPGFIGEFGIPQAEHPAVTAGDAPKWRALTERLLQEYDAQGWWATAWNAGNVLQAKSLYAVYHSSGGWNAPLDRATSAARTIEAHPSARLP